MQLENPLSRREFLKTAGITTIYPFLSDWRPVSEEVTQVNSYTIPNVVKEVDIQKIIDGLMSGLPAGKGVYVPDFIDLVQHTHRELTGMTYAEDMKKRLQITTPIEIVLLNDLQRARGITARFVHNAGSGQRNVAYLEANLKPTEFLHTLDNMLVYAVHGAGQLRGYAQTHRDISFMISQFPELLREHDGECTLTSIMQKYIGEGRRTNGEFKFELNTDVLPYLTLLSGRTTNNSTTWTPVKIDEAVQLATQSIPWVNQQLSALVILRLAKEGPRYLQRLAKAFADRTQEYILSKNVNFPEDKKLLLKRKMEIIARKYDKFLPYT